MDPYVAPFLTSTPDMSNISLPDVFPPLMLQHTQQSGKCKDSCEVCSPSGFPSDWAVVLVL